MTNTNIAAIGLKAKTGRAIAVVLRGPANAPQLIKRTELDLTDARVPATFQPYHEVMDLPWNESQVKVKPFIRAIEKVAAKALSELIRELQSEGLKDPRPRRRRVAVPPGARIRSESEQTPAPHLHRKGFAKASRLRTRLHSGGREQLPQRPRPLRRASLAHRSARGGYGLMVDAGPVARSAQQLV